MTSRQRDDLALELFRPISGFAATVSRFARHCVALGLVVAALTAWYLDYVSLGLTNSPPAERYTVRGLRAAVIVMRDDRGIPHVRAATLHDVYAAQGYVEGFDRLFQMDLTRRYAYGTLAEILGAKALPIDVSQRYYDLRDAARSQWLRLSAKDREALAAFSDGVNAAMQTRPLPVEFRLLLYRPQPWTPQDCVAVSLAVSDALSDSWRDVLARDDVWRRVGARAFDAYVPLSDPRYDVSLSGSAARAAPGIPRVAWGRFGADASHRLGSNAWAAGARRTAGGRALLANDPHLDLTIPGLWYLIDLHAPGLHVAGAAIPGVPGIVLGHNDRIAWGATNADVASASLFNAGRLQPARWVRETFLVRFAAPVTRAYYRTAREFGVPSNATDRSIVLVRPVSCTSDCSGISTFLALDSAVSAGDAEGALARYGGAAENFVIADRSGAVAYHLAGRVANDPAWGRYVHPARDAARDYAALPFNALPSAMPGPSGIVVTANNKMYGANYPYRLAAAFDPPYRAYRIAQLLHARARYDARYFAAMQLDTESPVERELARDLATASPELKTLSAWDGRFSPDSRDATLAYRLREALQSAAPSFPALIDAIRRHERSPTIDADVSGIAYEAERLPPWGVAGAVPVDHPLAPLRFWFLNGSALPGEGDEYTIHLQEPGFAQSFRAVWDVGNWDAGGIAIPSGESGVPGSNHYTDLTQAWIAGRLDSLPFSESGIRAATRERIVLEP